MTMENSKPWFSLCVATQFIEQQEDGIAIVDHVGVSQELDEYATMDDACAAIDSYLAQLGAKATWSDVGPVEKCACCGGDIDTSKPHKVLDLTECIGPFEDDSVQSIDGW